MNNYFYQPDTEQLPDGLFSNDFLLFTKLPNGYLMSLGGNGHTRVVNGRMPGQEIKEISRDAACGWLFSKSVPPVSRIDLLLSCYLVLIA